MSLWNKTVSDCLLAAFSQFCLNTYHIGVTIILALFFFITGNTLKGNDELPKYFESQCVRCWRTCALPAVRQCCCGSCFQVVKECLAIEWDCHKTKQEV